MLKIGVIALPSSVLTEKWVQGLKQAGADVTIFSFESHKIKNVTCVQVQPPTFLKAKEPNYWWFLLAGKQLRQCLKRHNIQIINPINISPYGVWAMQAKFQPMVGCAIGTDILLHQPDLAIVHAARNIFTKEHTKWRNQLLFKLKKSVFKYFVHKALHQSDWVVGDNLVLVDAMKRVFGMPDERVALNRWGVEPEYFDLPSEAIEDLAVRYQIPRNKKVVLSPRGLFLLYQPDLIFEAFTQVLEKGRKDTVFVVLTPGHNGQPPQSVLNQITALEARFPEQVRFIRTPLARTEVLGFWRLVDVFISAPTHDGYSNAVAEGRWAGAIPILNDIPASYEILEDGKTGFIVSPFNPTNLAKTIEKALDELDVLKPRMAAENRRWIEKHSLLAENMKIFVAKCEALYKAYASKGAIR